VQNGLSVRNLFINPFPPPFDPVPVVSVRYWENIGPDLRVSENKFGVKVVEVDKNVVLCFLPSNGDSCGLGVNK
jgi:hypothetical protein